MNKKCLLTFALTLLGIALISMPSSTWAQNNDNGGDLPYGKFKPREFYSANGVGTGSFVEDNSPADSDSAFSGTLSYNEDCKCFSCSGPASNCRGHLVTSGDSGYKSKNKKGTYTTYGNDAWECMPPAQDCYVIIQTK